MTSQVNQEHQSSLAVLMFTDIVDSAGIKNRHGPTTYGEVLTRHRVTMQNIIDAIPAAQVLQVTGDEIFARFPTASSAVDAALRFQHALSREAASPERIAVRIGIHMGEIAELDDRTIVGLAIDVANRVQALALPAQILLTRAAYDDARQFIRQHPPCCGSDDLPELQWMEHGPYRVQGLEENESIEIFEVGAEGIAPLTPPPDSAKAVRAVTPGEEENYGWRPAAGKEIPGQRGWILEEKLGEGGYGEVWLGIQQQTMRKVAFKFCFDVERVRALKMELTSHRILLKNLGERPDIAQLIDVQLDSPPFYLVSDYSTEGDLNAWAERQGGVKQVPLQMRLELFVRAARAVAAAHGVGALHRDLKPSNILVFIQDDQPRPKIADFGISVLTESGLKAAGEDTYAPTELSSTRSTGTGSQLYIPPEQLQYPTPEFTPQGDVYALGIMLYQLVIGDLARPLGHGWEKDVRDPLLREDIARAVDADLAQRFTSPNELADRIERLSSRRRARRIRRWSATGLAAALVLSTAGFLYSLEQQQHRHLRELEGIQLVWLEMMKAADPQYSGEEQATVDSLLESAVNMLDDERLADVPLAEADARLRLGRTFTGRGRHESAETQITLARDIYTGLNRSELVAEANHHLAYLHRVHDKREESKDLFREVLAERERLLGDNHIDTALTRYELSVVLRQLNELDDSRSLLEQAMAEAQAWRERQHPKDAQSKQRCWEIDVEIARMYNSKSRLYHELGDLEEAQRAADESLKRRIALLGERHRDVTRSLDTLARLHSERGNLGEAVRIQQELLEIRKQLLGSDHREVASAKWWISIGLLRQQKYDEAEVFAEKALAIRRKVFDDDTTEVAEAQSVLGLLRFEQGRHDEALELLRAAFETAEQEYDADNWRYYNIAGALAETLCVLGHCNESLTLLEATQEYVTTSERAPDWLKFLTDRRITRCAERCDYMQEVESSHQEITRSGGA